MECLNCGTEFDSPFCPNCGQKREVKPYSLSNIILSDLPKVLFNTEKGILNNIKSLAIRPKGFIEDYLKGKRVKVFKPLQFVFVCVTALILFDNYFASIESNLDPAGVKNMKYYNYGEIYGQFLKKNIRFLWIAMIVYCSIPSRVFFGRFNFAEHIIINCFVLGQACIYMMILFPLFPLRFLFNPFMFCSLWFIYSIVFYKKQDGWFASIALSFMAITFAYLLFFALPAAILYILN